MFVRGEGDQYPPIGKRGHPPLQAFLGPGCSGTNTRTHFTQFLLSLFGGDMDVLGDAFRSRFFGTHGFYFIATRTPESPAPANRDQTESVAVNCAAEHRKPCFGVAYLPSHLLCLFPRCAPCFWHLHGCTISDDVSGQRRLYDFPLTATLRRVTARSWHGFPVHDELSRGGSHPNTEYSDSFALP